MTKCTKMKIAKRIWDFTLFFGFVFILNVVSKLPSIQYYVLAAHINKIIVGVIFDMLIVGIPLMVLAIRSSKKGVRKQCSWWCIINPLCHC